MRLKALGNAIVPQVAYEIINAMLKLTQEEWDEFKTVENNMEAPHESYTARIRERAEYRKNRIRELHAKGLSPEQISEKIKISVRTIKKTLAQ